MEPQITPTSTQSRSKSQPKAIQISFLFWSHFGSDSGLVLVPFSSTKPYPKQVEHTPNINLRRQQLKFKKVYFVFAGPVESCCRACGVLSKSSGKSTQQPSKTGPEMVAQGYIDLGSDWAPSSERSGLHFGSTWAPSWPQGSIQQPLKKRSHSRSLPGRIVIDFGPQFGPQT